MARLVGAPHGAGPLLQRDYWGILRACDLTPQEVAAQVIGHFWRFPPADLVRFSRCDGTERPLAPGDEMDVFIRMAGRCKVRVVHRDANSMTMATLEGHPEAGRITFGAYPNLDGDVVFHIRSRARAGSWIRYAGFLVGGDPMQTKTWGDFVNRLAGRLADGVDGYVHIHKRRVAMTAADEAACEPTFVVRI